MSVQHLLIAVLLVAAGTVHAAESDKWPLVLPAPHGAVILPNEPVLPVTPAAVAPPAAGPWQPPVLGSLAVIFGIAALFKATLLLGPLALAFAFLAALGRQFSWAAIGGIAGLAALATSPWFWGIVGLAWVIDYLGLGSWYTSFL